MHMTSHIASDLTLRMRRTGTGDPTGHAIRYRHDDRAINAPADMVATSHDLGTEQGIFDHVVQAIIAQNARAPESNVVEDRETLTGDGLTCAYRGNRLRSPIGFLVTDAAYDDDLELLHLYSRNEYGRYPLIEALDPRIARDRGAISLIWMLQMAHDNPRTSCGARDWRSRWTQVMQRLATTLGLDGSSLGRPWGNGDAAKAA